MTYAIGSLVRARGREWVVLPETASETDLLVLRPLGGTDRETTGIYVGPGPDGRPFEQVSSAEFSPPDPATDLGNDLSGRLLRDAVRLGTTSVAGPFRSLGRIAVDPRPYQLLPLMMALKLDPVRLLIADDVGIGKTVEALLIARELLDRGEIRRFTVLCPPHLAEQWQRALAEQFHIDAALVLAGTAARLERTLPAGEGLFERYPFTVVSTDYIKQERRRFEFLRTCPELVIVDEAHTCADSGARGAGQLRHAMLRRVVEDPTRHLLLVTATPHSGSAGAFRSLLGLLDPELRELPDDLSGDDHRRQRERVARHLVQRRRADLTTYMNADTPFPHREIAEDTYALTSRYRGFLRKVVSFCRDSLGESDLPQHRHRVRWWSALALLRSISSSPAAATATLRNRAGNADLDSLDAIDAEGRRAVLDLESDSAEAIDVAPGGLSDDDGSSQARRLLELAREAENLAGRHDAKLSRAGDLVAALLKDGYAPILFCRFIPTVAYVADHLRKKLRNVTVEAIDGSLPPEERERRVAALGDSPRRVLVCTDCLSEGINLQDHFDAVLHYDLAWNPTRHEQREGRVDRYGQRRTTVRALTFYGQDNPVDGIVLDVLLRKHQAIQKALGVAVPVPSDSEVVGRAILEGLVLREKAPTQLDFGALAPDFLESFQREVDLAWEAAAEREKKSRTLFAHHQSQKKLHDELADELADIRRTLGTDEDVESFVRTGLAMSGATVSAKKEERSPLAADLAGAPAALRDAVGGIREFRAVFSGIAPDGILRLGRTHPVVAGLSSFVLESALDPRLGGPGRRAGAVRTRAVSARTVLLLLRLRYHLQTLDRDRRPQPLLAEEGLLVAFSGSPQDPCWLDDAAAEALLSAAPAGNIDPGVMRQHVSAIVAALPELRPALSQIAERRAKALLAAHRRVRQAVAGADRTRSVSVLEPVDLLGAYVYLPAGEIA